MARTALESGFDYAEVPALEIAAASNLSPFKGLPLECTNLFFPHGIRLFGGEPFDWRAYVTLLLPRAAELGVKLMTVGSGRARSAEEGEEGDTEERFLEMVAQIQLMAKPLGIVISPENLSPQETNVWNDYMRLRAATLSRSIGCTLDVYHVMSSPHSDFVLGRQDLPSHVHLSDWERKAYVWEDEFAIGQIAALMELKYKGRYSLELNQTDPAEWPNIAKRFHKCMTTIAESVP